jgi:hypothetical protein
MLKRNYRVPLSINTTASATFFVEAGSSGEAVAIARSQLIKTGRVMLSLDFPKEEALIDADVTPTNRVEEIAELEFLGEPTPEDADVDSELTPIELERYLLSDSGVCPFCGSRDIEGGNIDIECANAYQRVGCNRCGGSWTDRYRLAVEGPYHVHRPDRATIEAALIVDRNAYA